MGFIEKRATVGRLFRFFGGKHRAARYYPRPVNHAVPIIEPFAGSAGYASYWRDYKVILIEKDPVIADLWDYLINASYQDIMDLPLMKAGQRVEYLRVPDPSARTLIGLWLGHGDVRPRSLLTPERVNSDMEYWDAAVRKKVAERAQYIKHWKVICGDYSDAPDIEGTWFIDPPYAHAGQSYYEYSKLNFGKLASFCRSRRGQVIVCEQEGASWLPFRRFIEAGTSHGGKKSRELIWTKP